MPKPVQKRSGKSTTGKVDGMPTRQLLDELYSIRSLAWNIGNRVSQLELILCSKGLTDKGPVRESRDDIPF